MQKDNITISEKLKIAMQMDNDRMIQHILQEETNKITDKVMAAIGIYADCDLPFVAASLLIISNTLKSTLSNAGKDLADEIVNRSMCVVTEK